MKKRGLSAVVTSLVLILLVLVAVAIIWIVIQSFLKEGGEEISNSKITLDLKIKSVVDNQNNITVKIKRNVGDGELVGINFIIKNGLDTEKFKVEDVNMKELDEKEFDIIYNGLIKELSIAPIFLTGSGKEKSGGITDTLTFTNEKIIELLGGVTWWDFSDGSTDVFGVSDGKPFNGTDCSIEGKFGNACNFYDHGDKIIIPHNPKFQTENGTIMFWFKLYDTSLQNQSIITKDAFGCDTSEINTNCGDGNPPDIRDDTDCDCGHFYVDFNDHQSEGCLYSVNNLCMRLQNDGNNNSVYLRGDKNKLENGAWQDDTWYHFAFTFDSVEYLKLYIDGELHDSNNTNKDLEFEGMRENTWPFMIGHTNFSISSESWFLNGSVDEFIFFNKALTEEKIKDIYNYDFS